MAWRRLADLGRAVALGVVLAATQAACGGGGGNGGGGADAVADTGGKQDVAYPDTPAPDAAPDAADEVAGDTPDAVGDTAVADEPSPPDAPADQAEPDQAPADAPPADAPADAPPSDVPPECADDQDCLDAHGPAATCMGWKCEDGKCAETALPKGAICTTDDDECLDEVFCDGEGHCGGTMKSCDDGEACTYDTCQPGVGCTNDPYPPKACVDGEGKAGVQECAGGAWGPCLPASACDLKVNTNTTGTVNPFIWPARSGNFYVSYVAKEDAGGNLKLAWVDPKTCKVVVGPLNVNDKPGTVYYWGAQSVISDQAGNFYAVWEGKMGSGLEIGFAASETGDLFGPAIETVSVSKNGGDPAIVALAPGKVIASWRGYDGAQYDPWFSFNFGVFGDSGWAEAVRVASSEVQDDQTAIAVDGAGNVLVAWQSFDDGTPEGGNIYVAKSTDQGATFGTPVRVNDVLSKANVGKARFMVAGPAGVWVAWSDTRTDSEGDVYIDFSADGTAFGTDLMVNDDTHRWQEDPSIALGQGSACANDVYVVWQDLRGNDGWDIYGARSTDGGKTFAANVRVNPNADGDQMNPAITIDYGCVAGASWRDDSGNEDFDIRATFSPSW
jgi:hypothetical protein